MFTLMARPSLSGRFLMQLLAMATSLYILVRHMAAKSSIQIPVSWGHPSGAMNLQDRYSLLTIIKHLMVPFNSSATIRYRPQVNQYQTPSMLPRGMGRNGANGLALISPRYRFPGLSHRRRTS